MENRDILGPPGRTNTVLLVGGDLCARTAERLDPGHWCCIGLRRRAMNADSGPDSRLHWLRADLADPATLARALASIGPITHLVYAPAPDARTAQAYDRAYPAGLRALLDVLPDPEGLQRCVLVDSTAVWGPDTTASDADAWVDEDTPAVPADFRGAAMLAAEALLHTRLPGRGTALRLSGLYGPERLRLLDGLRAGRIIAPDGPGHWANRIHIDDAAQACVHLLMQDDPLPCVIGTDDRPLPTGVLYETLARLAGGPAPVHEFRPPDGKRLSNARLRASGWTPAWPDMLEGYAAAITASQSRT